jgi:hypothetical protein
MPTRLFSNLGFVLEQKRHEHTRPAYVRRHFDFLSSFAVRILTEVWLDWISFQVVVL